MKSAFPILASTAMACVNAFMVAVDELFFRTFSVFFTGGYVKALEITTEMPGGGACKPRSISEETYDDVEYPGRAG